MTETRSARWLAAPLLSFKSSLSAQQIRDVGAFVASRAKPGG